MVGAGERPGMGQRRLAPAALRPDLMTITFRRAAMRPADMNFRASRMLDIEEDRRVAGSWVR